MLGSLLFLGMLLGLKHALEADHLSAIATLAARSASTRDTLRVALAWGAGHAAALALGGTALIALGVALPDRLGHFFDLAIGATLVLLGFAVLLRLRRESAAPHSHECPGHAATLRRSVLVGAVHGFGGSGAIMVVWLPLTHSGLRAFGYLMVFGAGTIFGMALLSLLVSLPFKLSSRYLQWATRGLEGALGLANIGLGCWIALASGLL
jgi:hypothetical protein